MTFNESFEQEMIRGNLENYNPIKVIYGIELHFLPLVLKTDKESRDRKILDIVNKIADNKDYAVSLQQGDFFSAKAYIGFPIKIYPDKSFLDKSHKCVKIDLDDLEEVTKSKEGLIKKLEEIGLNKEIVGEYNFGLYALR